MRVNTSYIFCPSYCFSKPAPPSGIQPPPPPPPPQPSAPLFPPSPPVQWQPYASETEDSHHHTSCNSSPGSVKVEKLRDEKVEIDENGVDGRKSKFILKSSLKKSSASASKDIVRECVKWMDDLGEELVEIREFDPIESGELDDEMNGYSTCTCVIL